MPIKEAAKKYVRITRRKTERNKKVKGILRGAIKKTTEAVKAGRSEDAAKYLKAAIKALDKAAQKGIIKKNYASRKKSRLNKMVKELIKKS